MRKILPVIGFFILMISTPVTAYASNPDSYKLMDVDGTVNTVLDADTTTLIENIRSASGDEAAEAYIKAMEMGSYSEFYDIVGTPMPTYMHPEYMVFDGAEETGIVYTSGQEQESLIQFFYGPEGNIAQVGNAAKEAGYEVNNAGATQYELDVIMEKAERPSDAGDVMPLLSEANIEPRNTIEAELINKKIIVEHTDDPMTEREREIAEYYQYEIIPESEAESRYAEVFGSAALDISEKIEETPVVDPEEVGAEIEDFTNWEEETKEASTNQMSKEAFFKYLGIFMAIALAATIIVVVALKKRGK